MHSTSQPNLAQQQVLDDQVHSYGDESRWPIPQAVLFIVFSAAACWAVLIGFVMWLFG